PLSAFKTRRPPTATLSPYTRSSDLPGEAGRQGHRVVGAGGQGRRRLHQRAVHALVPRRAGGGDLADEHAAHGRQTRRGRRVRDRALPTPGDGRRRRRCRRLAAGGRRGAARAVVTGLGGSARGSPRGPAYGRERRQTGPPHPRGRACRRGGSRPASGRCVPGVPRARVVGRLARPGRLRPLPQQVPSVSANPLTSSPSGTANSYVVPAPVSARYTPSDSVPSG